MGAIYLVRHGQASFGAADYDRLSPHGEEQARLLGASLRARAIEPAKVVSGALRRQRATADHLARAAGWPLRLIVDAGWDEFRLDAADDGPGISGQTDNQAFQAALEVRMRRWESDGGGSETLREFTERALRALADVAESLGPGEDAVVVTSAGVISLVASSLLGGGTEPWILLNRVCVNTGVTTVVTGRRGLSLLSFNEHGHLGRGDISYR
jgi:broad specificity phosphatase PhoE